MENVNEQVTVTEEVKTETKKEKKKLSKKKIIALVSGGLAVAGAAAAAIIRGKNQTIDPANTEVMENIGETFESAE